LNGGQNSGEKTRVYVENGAGRGVRKNGAAITSKDYRGAHECLLRAGGLGKVKGNRDQVHRQENSRLYVG